MRLTTFLLLGLLSLNLNAAGKSAFINVKVLLEESPQALAANAELKKQFGDREQSLLKLGQNIQQMEKTYQNDSAIMSDEQKKKAEDNIVQNKRRFQFERQSLQEDVEAKRRELLKKVESEIKAVIKNFGDKNGYDYIYSSASLVYASDAVNITDQILQELKQQ